MNLIVNAVSSIVDAQTHYLDASSAPDYRDRERHGRSIRARSVLASLDRLGNWIGVKVGQFRARFDERRQVNQLLRLNDHLLQDIGLSRADLLAVLAGFRRLADLDAARGRGQAFGSLAPARQPSNKIEPGKAANEAEFGLARCA